MPKFITAIRTFGKERGYDNPPYDNLDKRIIGSCTVHVNAFTVKHITFPPKTKKGAAKRNNHKKPHTLINPLDAIASCKTRR